MMLPPNGVPFVPFLPVGEKQIDGEPPIILNSAGIFLLGSSEQNTSFKLREMFLCVWTDLESCLGKSFHFLWHQSEAELPFRRELNFNARSTKRRSKWSRKLRDREKESQNRTVWNRNTKREPKVFEQNGTSSSFLVVKYMAPFMTAPRDGVHNLVKWGIKTTIFGTNFCADELCLRCERSRYSKCKEQVYCSSQNLPHNVQCELVTRSLGKFHSKISLPVSASS